MAKKLKKFIFSFIFICLSLFLCRPFIVSQLVKRAEGYVGFNMYKDAVREYKKALMLGPDNSWVMDGLGYAYKSLKDIDNAIAIYERAIKTDPLDIIAYHDLGLIYAMNQEFKLAKEYFLKGSSIPHEHKEDMGELFYSYHSASLSMLALCQERLGEIEDAIKTNKRILEYYPDNKLARDRIKRLSQMKSLKEELPAR